MEAGIRLKGQWATQRPQRMQAEGTGSSASFSSKAMMALVFFMMGASRLGTEMPIMGPPYSTFFGSHFSPAKSSRFWMGVPTGAMMFWGLAMAEPSTVTTFSTRGIPVRMYLAITARVVQLITIAPTSMGSLPSGTTSPVVL